MHTKYEVSTSNGSKVIANVKVDNRQTDRQTNKQTGQKQYAPDHSIRGHKNMPQMIQTGGNIRNNTCNRFIPILRTLNFHGLLIFVVFVEVPI